MNNLMRQVKGVYQIRLNKAMEDEQNEDIETHMDDDNNKILQILVIKYTFKTIRLLIIIVFLSYYIGICTYIAF